MIRCQEVLEKVTLQAAGEVGPEERRVLEAHLRACPTCSDAATDLRLALQALEEGDAPDPGESYWTAFDARLRGRIARSGLRSRRRRSLAMAAAAVLVSGLALVAVRRERDARREEPDAVAVLETLLERAASGPGGMRAAQAVLDEMVPVDELEIEDALGSLSSEEREALVLDLSRTGGRGEGERR